MSLAVILAEYVSMHDKSITEHRSLNASLRISRKKFSKTSTMTGVMTGVVTGVMAGVEVDVDVDVIDGICTDIGEGGSWCGKIKAMSACGHARLILRIAS
jgi:hypothetical protein